MLRTRHVLALLLVAGLAGCGTGDDREQARAVVETFYDDVRGERGAEACEQLSDNTLQQLESQTGQSCPDVITRLSFDGGAIVAANVYVTNAKVDLRSGESAFLSRESDGWKLSAIGCTPAPGRPRDEPFDCEVEA